MENIKLKPMKNITAFRKFSIASWKDSYDPNNSIIAEIKMEKAQEYIKKFRKQKNQPIIILHLIIKAMADAVNIVPEVNSVLRFGKLYQRQGVTIGSAIATSVAGKEEGLYNIRLEDTEKKSLEEIVIEVNKKIKESRSHSREADAYATLSQFPSIFLRPVLWLLYALMFKFNLHLPFLKLERDPFGIVEITYIGALGLDNVILPLTPYTGVPIVVGPGVMQDMPFVENGQVVARKGMRISLSADHRFVDGYHAAKIVHSLKAYLEDPFAHYDELNSELGDEQKHPVGYIEETV